MKIVFDIVLCVNVDNKGMAGSSGEFIQKWEVLIHIGGGYGSLTSILQRRGLEKRSKYGFYSLSSGEGCGEAFN